jgi:hypothetical protein
MSMGTGKSKRLIGLGLAIGHLALRSEPAERSGHRRQRHPSARFFAATVGGNVWSLRDSQTTGDSNNTFLYGDPDGFPIMGDWDGDGEKTPGIVRGNLWALRNSNDSGFGDTLFTFGDPDAFPVIWAAPALIATGR